MQYVVSYASYNSSIKRNIYYCVNFVVMGYELITYFASPILTYFYIFILRYIKKAVIKRHAVKCYNRGLA